MQINPIIEKELKTKMRGWKFPALISVYLAFLGLVVLLSFLSANESMRYSISYFNPRLAIDTYNVLAFMQMLLILAITPALTAAAISSERERQTLDLLLCTNLPTFSVVAGKVFVSIAHVLLLVTASLPVMATVFLYGGIRISDLLLLFSFYISVALFLGSIGILYSCIFKKSAISMILSYITVGALIIGTPILMLVSHTFVRHLQTAPTNNEIMAFLFSNPIYGYASLIDGNLANSGFFARLFMFGGTASVPSNPFLQPWIVNMAFNIVAALIITFLASLKLRPVWKRKRNKGIAAVETNRV